MAHHQSQYAPPTQTDEYGKPIRQTDEYGNPIPHGGATAGFTTTTTGQDEYGNPIPHGGATAGVTTTTTGQEGHKLHRTGSGSSSSSSEDDGQGGRRKKGLKEKLTGKHKGDDHQTYTSATTIPGGGGHHIPTGTHDEGHEKKGIMDKIKEKLPGHHDHDQD